ncbi:hypothetical protein NPS01_30700 [Nocardioides psychrotolerans]|uniref:Uncharacterized protein n=1 Tax=Nocardioides psychrotolerans TaxID=1005945 RepID=A0A1I3NML4_9ACTN|nr:hypothetical protein [Nocardioides psychrotolerans]GEP39407.1 hypothetical protein NPS01_30700 [Nocardioides psychrotolerans]SFJ10392.1 hypothetical protein SAMN05216561_11850 [Nocardioides psychrotolerans]
MRVRIATAVGVLALVALVPSAAATPIASTACSELPADNWWHADVSSLPVHARSQQWLSHMSTASDLHPDFGPSFGDGPDYGIPITVVRSSHATVPVRFTYAAESDRVRYPLGPDTRIEGGRSSDGDRHAIIVDRGRCRLYETYDTRLRDGRWRAGSGAVWSLRSNALRPDGWTSADAAGLPILPGLLRWNEVRDDDIDHAIRFTTDVTSTHHLWPARHDAGSRTSLAYPPMGARFRLRASWSAAGLSSYARRVVGAMKTYGLVLADNGSPWFFQGEQHAAWPEELIEDLKTIPASAFVAVDISSLQVSENSGAIQDRN